ncbi:MAG: hypothetical protein NZ988_05225 [Thaumarchaeota archaeon]|nr:hypothetical protein [Candidatus Calditenuaceae archaeon]MDW8187428.1 hypothetical protein [Nitrososphaerota archaeon]
MRKLNRLVPVLIGAALLLLLSNTPPIGSGSNPFIAALYFIEIGSGQPLLHEVEVVVLHSIDWGEPRRARPGEAVIFLASEVRRVGYDGEVKLKVPRGNHSMSVYWADGRFVPFRTNIVVDKDLRVIVKFTEVRLRPEAFTMLAEVTRGTTTLTVTFSVFRLNDLYLAPPIVRYVTTSGELRAVPPVSRPDAVSVLPYSIRPRSLMTLDSESMNLEGEVAPTTLSINLELPGIAATILSDSYIPMLVMDHLVQPLERA